MRKNVIACTMMLVMALVSICPPLTSTTVAAPLQSGTTVYPIEETPVWRVQLRIGTADVYAGGALGSGGTNDFVDVKLNADNTTRLYSSFDGGNNFERGDSFGFDLKLGYVRKLRDITMIQISKLEAKAMGAHVPGSDWLCISSLSLSVNGRVVYDITFPAGFWLGSNTLTISSSQLRNHTLWRSYTMPPLPQLISGAELIHRVDGIVGDFIGGPTLRSGWLPAPLWWRNMGDYAYAVKVAGNGATAIHVDLALTYFNGQRGAWEPVDVNFDLDFSCGSGKLFVTTRNLDMRGYPVVDSLTQMNKQLFGSILLQTMLPLEIQSALQTITYRDAQGQPACPPVRVVGNSVYLF